MRYLQDSDYSQLIDDKSLSAIAGENNAKLLLAETTALDEACGYLDRFDINALLALTGDNRPAKFVSVVCDITLYHLTASLSGRMGADTRKERYELAIAWLKAIQSGKNTPVGFPVPSTAEDADSGSIMFGSENSNNFVW